MADPSEEQSIVNSRRPSLVERAGKRRGTKGSGAKAASGRGFVGFLLQSFRLLVLFAVIGAGGVYINRYYLGPSEPEAPAPKKPQVVKTRAEEARESYYPEPPTVYETVLGDVIERRKDPGPPTIFDTNIPGGETYEQYSKRMLAEIDWEFASKLIEPTRELLDRLEKAEKELPELKRYLEEVNRDGIFGEYRWRNGGDARLLKSWLDRRYYKFPVSRSDLEKWRKNFEAAAGRSKAGTALDEDRATIFKTYEFAGKTMKLDLERGMFVIPRNPTGPEEDVAELKRVKRAVNYDR